MLRLHRLAILSAGVSRICTILSVLLLSQVLVAQPANRACAAAEHYTVHLLPLRPWHINNSSQAAGTAPPHVAAIWSERDGLRKIPTPSGFSRAEAVGINNLGHAVGYVTDNTASQRRGFRYADGKMSLLAGQKSNPHAINDADQVVGESSLPGSPQMSPVLWQGQTIFKLPACCGGTATAINRRAVVVGDMYDREGRYHAFTWDRAHGIQPLGPQSDFSAAVAINSTGHVVVDAFSQGMLLYEDGKSTRMDLPAKFPAKPAAINDCDVVVGGFGPYSDAERAFVWDKKTGFHDLNERIPADSGWKLERATSINDKGEVVGWGDYHGTEDAGFLLKPE